MDASSQNSTSVAEPAFSSGNPEQGVTFGPVRVSEFEVFHAHVPLKKKIRHASHTRTSNETLLVRCRLDDGTVGWGEGLPREYVTGETFAEAWEMVDAIDWPRWFADPVTDISSLIERLATWQLPDPPAGKRDSYGNAIRCAVELSVLDACLRTIGRPLSSLTPLIPGGNSVYARHDRVRYGVPFTAMGALKQIVRCYKLKYYGFRDAKVKTGISVAKDVSTLRRVRKWLGPDFDLRIDANEAWTCENLEARLSPLVSFGITSVEQPVPHENVGGLARLRGKIGVPLMLDESLCSLSDAKRAIADGTCDLFNIRLSKCGGFVNSVRLAAIAQQAGLGYQLGSLVGETGILSAAGRHFATSVADIRYHEGSYDRFLVQEPLTTEDLTFRHGGFAPELTGPGLGITVDPAAVERVTRAKKVFPLR